MSDRKLKEFLWHSSLLWKILLLIPEDAYGLTFPLQSGSPT